MRIPRFWTRAQHDGFEAPGWSFTSLDEARRVAQERVRLLADVIQGKREPQGRYLYGDRPVREPVVESIGERPDALITRNLYGALCLNTEDVVFVDVDDPEDANLDRIRRAASANPSWGMRVYRTNAGFRVLGTHARMSPSGAEIGAMFDALGADPLYRKLCAAQESFRARLTPKPWRIGAGRVPARFPYRDDEAARRAADWVAEYDELSRGHAVCQLLETHGPAASDPLIQRIVELHDARTVSAGKPLA